MSMTSVAHSVTVLPDEVDPTVVHVHVPAHAMVHIHHRSKTFPPTVVSPPTALAPTVQGDVALRIIGDSLDAPAS